MEIIYRLSLFTAILSLSSTVNCSDKWCPCIGEGNGHTMNSSRHMITAHVCEKNKGILFSEERQFKCECCLILKGFEQSCNPAKAPNFVIRCEDGLVCDHKYICRVPKKDSHSVSSVIDSSGPNLGQQISRSNGMSFAELLQKVFGCDCSTAKCNNEITRQECEDHQGLFIDKLSVRNKCQCCDRCYIPREHHEICGHFHKQFVQYVCDTGLYCSPFTQKCLEKHEIINQFMVNIRKENMAKRRMAVSGDVIYHMPDALESLEKRTEKIGKLNKGKDESNVQDNPTVIRKRQKKSGPKGEKGQFKHGHSGVH